jgi:hypothetical protein
MNVWRKKPKGDETISAGNISKIQVSSSQFGPYRWLSVASLVPNAQLYLLFIVKLAALARISWQ